MKTTGKYHLVGVSTTESLMIPQKDLNVSESKKDIEFDDIILTCRWVLEGILLLFIGCIGIVGMEDISIK